MIERKPISEVYLGDCMEFMAKFPDKFFNIAICDPEYGSNDAIGIANGKKHSAKRTNYKVFKNVAPEQEYFNELKRVSKKQIIWGGNFFGLRGGYICWNKNGTAFGEAELAWSSFFNSVRLIEYTWNGMIQGNMKDKEERIHVTQKPVQLYKILMKEFVQYDDKILDTHMGSQSSRIAAYKLGFDYYGSEIDPDYFKEGNARFEKSISEPLFDQPTYVQSSII